MDQLPVPPDRRPRWRPTAPTLPAVPRIFRPPIEREVGRSYPVVVVGVLAVGNDSAICCRQVDAGKLPWHFEAIVMGRRVVEGELGTVRCTGPYRTFPLHWAYRRREDETPALFDCSVS